MKKLILLLTLAVVTVAGVQNASAQVGPLDKTGTGTWGIIIPAYNTVDSLIYDGQVVMIDTTSVVKRFGVKRYSGTLSDRLRVVGLAVGDIPKSSKGGAGRVLIYGYHKNAFAAKALAAGTSLKLGAINSQMATSDSMALNVARILRGVSGASVTDCARYGVWWYGIGGKVDGSL